VPSGDISSFSSLSTGLGEFGTITVSPQAESSRSKPKRQATKRIILFIAFIASL
jgi:hypothetical protein